MADCGADSAAAAGSMARGRKPTNSLPVIASNPCTMPSRVPSQTVAGRWACRRRKAVCAGCIGSQAGGGTTRTRAPVLLASRVSRWRSVASDRDPRSHASRAAPFPSGFGL